MHEVEDDGVVRDPLLRRPTSPLQPAHDERVLQVPAVLQHDPDDNSEEDQRDDGRNDDGEDVAIDTGRATFILEMLHVEVQHRHHASVVRTVHPMPSHQLYGRLLYPPHERRRRTVADERVTSYVHTEAPSGVQSVEFRRERSVQVRQPVSAQVQQLERRHVPYDDVNAVEFVVVQLQLFHATAVGERFTGDGGQSIEGDVKLATRNNNVRDDGQHNALNSSICITSLSVFLA